MNCRRAGCPNDVPVRHHGGRDSYHCSRACCQADYEEARLKRRRESRQKLPPGISPEQAEARRAIGIRVPT